MSILMLTAAFLSLDLLTGVDVALRGHDEGGRQHMRSVRFGPKATSPDVHETHDKVRHTT